MFKNTFENPYVRGLVVAAILSVPIGVIGVWIFNITLPLVLMIVMTMLGSIVAIIYGIADPKMDLKEFNEKNKQH